MKHHVNYFFLIIAASLIFFGALFMSTLSAPESLQVFNTTNHYLFRHLTRIGIGLFLAFIAFKIPIKVWQKSAFFLLLINLLLLVAVAVPHFGTEFLGARRWLSIGNNSFQPSEFLKLTAILYLAAWLARRVDTGPKQDFVSWLKKSYHSLVNVLVPFLVFLGLIIVFLYLQRDVSTLGIIGVTLVVVYFASGTNLWHTLVTFSVGLVSIGTLIFMEPYRIQRFLVFLHPETDPLGIGMQMKQSLIAVGSGGLFGQGLGMSTQKFGFLPEAISDSIFAIIGEEMGFVGATILVSVFLLFFWQALRIADQAEEKFARLSAIGIATWILFQAFVNISSNIGLFPLSGIPLPFFSYGGSHIVAELIGVGLLLNISKHHKTHHE